MNKNIHKITAVLLSLMIVLCGAFSSLALFEEGSEKEKTSITDVIAGNETQKEEESDSADDKGENKTLNIKDETVYVFADATGDVTRIIVSDWLRNLTGEKTLKDFSVLTNIVNLKGDEKFTQNKGGVTSWEALGNDIYYQGETDKNVPVVMDITYTLNGKAITPERIAGKSGKVTIRFTYENREYETVEINGEKVKIYVPFVVATGIILSNENFSNVEVENGKLINDGERSIIVGVSLPGMQESIGLDSDILNIPDFIEITADTNYFCFDTAFSVATNSVFNNIDASKYEGMAEGLDLPGAISQLTDGMEQLINGSSELYDGIGLLLEKSAELVNGIGQLADGAKQIADGAAEIDSNMETFVNGIATLTGGANQLAMNNDELNDGARQIFEGLLATASDQLTSNGIEVPEMNMDNYREVLEGIIPTLDSDSVYQKVLAYVTAEVEKNRPLIVQGVTDAVREEVAAQVIPVATLGLMTKESYETAVEEKMISQQVQKVIENAIEEQMASDDVKAIIAENIEIQYQKAINDAMNSSEVKSKLNAASGAITTISTLITSLDNVKLFYQGLLTYTDGVNQVAGGAGQILSGAYQLKDGTGLLSGGAKELYDGISLLRDQIPALVEGIEQLKDGALQLNEGLNLYKEEGIDKIAELADIDLNSFLTRIKAIQEVSKDYKAFTGIDSEMNGQVKFIYRVVFETE